MRYLNSAEDVEILVLAAVRLEVELWVFFRGNFEKVGMPVREDDILKKIVNATSNCSHQSPISNGHTGDGHFPWYASG